MNYRGLFPQRGFSRPSSPPRVLSDGEVVDIGGKRVRYIDTPHVPHGWDAGVIFEETTQTLFCGDLFAHVGNPSALTEREIIGPAMAAEDLFHATKSRADNGANHSQIGRTQAEASRCHARCVILR